MHHACCEFTKVNSGKGIYGFYSVSIITFSCVVRIEVISDSEVFSARERSRASFPFDRNENETQNDSKNSRETVK